MLEVTWHPLKDPAVLTARNYRWLALGNARGVGDDVAFGTPVDTCRPFLSTGVGGGIKELEWTCAAHLEILREFQKILLRLDIRVHREVITKLKNTYVYVECGRKLG
jgi:hypothetical protein